MGFFKALMGGGTPPNSKLKNNDILDKEYKALRDPTADLLKQGVTGEGGELSLEGIPSYDGSFTAPVTGNENWLLGQIMNRATSQTGTISRSNDLLSSVVNGEWLDPSANPYLQDKIDAAVNPLVSKFENETMPALQSQLHMAGQNLSPDGSSIFTKMAGMAGNDLLGQISDATQQTVADNLQNERDLQTAAVDQTTAYDQQQYDQLQSALQAEALPRLVEQYGKDQAQVEFQNRLTSLLSLLKGQVNITQPMLTSTQPQSGYLWPALDTAASLAKTAAMASASDRRLKAGIVPLGVEFKGIPLYEFSYKGEPEVRRWGVMAQEVPEHCRVVMPNGYLGVIYPELARL